MRIKLTTKGSIKKVDALEPKATRYEVRTELKELLLVVHPSGVKSYVVQLGRGKRKTLKHHPVMTPEAARRQAIEALRELDDHGLPATTRKRKTVTFERFLEDHYQPWALAETKAGKATVANLKAQFGELFNKKSLTEITAWQIEKFKAKRIKSGIKPTTVNRDLDRIRAALAKAVEWGFLAANPLTTVKRSKVEEDGRVRYLDPAEEARLRDAIAQREDERRRSRVSGNAWALARGRAVRPEWVPDQYTDHVAPLVLLALNTGLRRGELFSLAWDSVDLDRAQLRVAAATAKSRRTRYVPLNSQALEVLQRLKRRTAGAGLVFPGADGSRMTHIKRSWAALLKSAEIEDFHFHDCRHHFASRLVMSGADLYVVKELLGHSDFAMTQRYAHLSPEHKAAAVERLVAGR